MVESVKAIEEKNKEKRKYITYTKDLGYFIELYEWGWVECFLKISTCTRLWCLFIRFFNPLISVISILFGSDGLGQIMQPL